MVDFGKEVRLVLAARGETAREIAERSGFSEVKISRLLNGRTRLTTEARRRLLTALYPEGSEEVTDDHSAA